MTVIIVLRKKTADIETYSSLVSFCEQNKEYNSDMLYNITSRKKKPFEDDEIKLLRCHVITRMPRKSK